MEELEYLLLKGNGWRASVNFPGGGHVPPREIGSDEIALVINRLLLSKDAMTFDEHPKAVVKLEIDFEKKSLKLVAKDIDSALEI
jgi:hypothetical protein